MSAPKRVAQAAKTIRVRWEQQVSTDPQTEAAQALEDAGQLLDPEVAAELVAFRKERELAEVIAGSSERERAGLLARYERALAPFCADPAAAAVAVMAVRDHEAVWLLRDAQRRQDRVAELEADLATVNGTLDDVAKARRAESCPCPPEGRPHQVGCPQAEVPRPAERPVDGLTQSFAPVAALREVLDGEHYAQVHHGWRLGRDLPETGGQR